MGLIGRFCSRDSLPSSFHRVSTEFPPFLRFLRHGKKRGGSYLRCPPSSLAPLFLSEHRPCNFYGRQFMDLTLTRQFARFGTRSRFLEKILSTCLDDNRVAMVIGTRTECVRDAVPINVVIYRLPYVAHAISRSNINYCTIQPCFNCSPSE